jgi:hypothetical protein
VNGSRPTRPASRRVGLWTAMLAVPLAITLVLPSDSSSPIVAAIDAGAFMWTVLGAPYFVAVLVFELHRVLTEHMEEAHPEPSPAHPEPAAPGQRSNARDQRASRSTPVEPPAGVAAGR